MTAEALDAAESFFDDRATPAGDVVAQPKDTPLLLQLWHLVLRWKWLILGIVALSLIAGLVVTLMMTPQFTAKARVEISRQEKKVTNVQGIEQSDNTFDAEFYQTQYQLLTARSLADRIVKDLRLAADESFFAAHGADSATVAAPYRGLDAGQRQARERAAAELLLDHVQISPIARSSLVDIQYTSADPIWSAKIANAWASKFIAASMDRRFESTADARRFLEGRLSDLRQRLETAERTLVGYATRKNIVTLSASQEANGQTRQERTLAADDLSSLNRELAEATASRISAESRLAAQRGRNVSAAVLNSNAIATLRQRRAEAASEYARLMVQFEPGYPAARALQQQIAALDASISTEEARIQGGLQADFKEASRREAELSARVSGLIRRLNTQNSDSIQYNLYQREVDTTRDLYNALLQRYKEIDVAGISANYISIIDQAEAPEGSSSPNLPLNLAIALLAGIALSGAIIFALEQIEEGIRDPAQLQNALGTPLLGTIPKFDNDNTLEEVADAKSHVAEAYLSIRTDLALATSHGVPRSMMLTSAQPAEGKSTSSLSLAIAIARTGKSVLLMDGDMRSPSVHVVLGQNNLHGFSNFLAGEEDFDSLIQGTSVPGISIMSAGPTPPSAAELLSSERLETLVANGTARFDHVIIDSPPMLGLADAPLIARSVEAVVFVVQAGRVPVRALRGALDRLRRSGTRIAGAILTKFEANNSSYGYGYGGIYGYGYGDTAAKS